MFAAIRYASHHEYTVLSVDPAYVSSCRPNNQLTTRSLANCYTGSHDLSPQALIPQLFRPRFEPSLRHAPPLEQTFHRLRTERNIGWVGY